MGCDTYSVWIHDIAVARYMPIELCLLFVKALFTGNVYENELTIKKEEEAQA